MENFWIVARQVWILFTLIGVGAVCRRIKMVDEASSRCMTNILLYIVTPCLIVDAFQRPFEPALLGQLGIAFGIAFLVHVAVITLAHLAVRRGDIRRTSVLKTAIVFSNAGFMGIPLEQALFGEKGVFFGIVYVAMFNLFIWSWGLHTTRGVQERTHMRTLIFNPGTIGLGLGLLFFLLSVRLPDIVAQPVSMMAALNTPLAMLLIGYFLAGANPVRVLVDPGALAVGVMRLLVAPLLLIAALYPFRAHLDREMMLALVTASSAPVAAMVAMFAAKFGRDVELGVALVCGSTLASLVTMPAAVAFAMAVL